MAFHWCNPGHVIFAVIFRSPKGCSRKRVSRSHFHHHQQCCCGHYRLVSVSTSLTTAADIWTEQILSTVLGWTYREDGIWTDGSRVQLMKSFEYRPGCNSHQSVCCTPVRISRDASKHLRTCRFDASCQVKHIGPCARFHLLLKVIDKKYVVSYYIEYHERSLSQNFTWVFNEKYIKRSGDIWDNPIRTVDTKTN